MKTDLTNDVLHNPFKNRFNDPVTWRLDEMQAHSNVVRERDHSETKLGASRANVNVASIFTFVIVLLASVFVLFRG